jgi:endonuclease/exonuclease/phosphatase (EEP) superfamily protein YafD
VSSVILGLAVVLLFGSLLPFSKVPHGAVRGLDFPRQQFFAMAVGLAAVLPFFASGRALIWGLIMLVLVAVLQMVHIAKFTPLWRQQSVDANRAERAARGAQISLLAANVKLSNRDYGRLIEQVRNKDPDLVMAIEVDEDWIAALVQGLNERYPERIDVPKDNGYGMCVLSKLPLSDSHVRERVTQAVPSISTKVTLRDGRDIRLRVVHPEPPVIDHDTKGRDSEMALIGLEAAEDTLPTIVAGDLNDVAWSTTTRRFQRLSQLLDPRVGRGFFNTFSATMPWMRWPLDHLFHDPAFRVIHMARLGKIGSDHFPMWFELALAQTPAQDSEPGTADRAEKAEVKEMIEEERHRERRAIGSDWEDG